MASATPLMDRFYPVKAKTSDPHLGPLQMNSPGNTPTMAIVPGSSAFNSADQKTSMLVDQRGVTRPQQGPCRPPQGGFDIGAFEARSPFGAP